MTTIYLLRHGEYQNPKNVAPFRLSGFSLSKTGKKQAEETAAYLTNKKISVIYSSPVLRCKQTAKIIGNRLVLKPKISRLIIETDSPFQGSPKTRFKNWWAESTTHPFHLKHGGETIEKIALRFSKFIAIVLKRHSGENILVVSHGEPSMILIYQLVDNSWKKYLRQTKTNIPKGGLAKLEFKGHQLKEFSQINY